MSASLRPLRPHQVRALEALRGSLAGGKRRPMLQAPTGFGKTLTAAHIIQRALDKGKRVAFVVPALSLIDQTVAAFEGEGIHCIGVMQGIHERTDRDQPVQVCSVQTLARRKRPEVDLVLVDEAHQQHREIFGWMKDRPDSLSAHRALARIEIELAHHGGNDNGKLPVTFDDFVQYGVRRHSIDASRTRGCWAGALRVATVPDAGRGRASLGTGASPPPKSKSCQCRNGTETQCRNGTKGQICQCRNGTTSDGRNGTTIYISGGYTL
jgi:Type III restriction enzyme, res subunit